MRQLILSFALILGATSAQAQANQALPVWECSTVVAGEIALDHTAGVVRIALTAASTAKTKLFAKSQILKTCTKEVTNNIGLGGVGQVTAYVNGNQLGSAIYDDTKSVLALRACQTFLALPGSVECEKQALK